MAYESLYRRYRPQRFAEVRGQDHVVTALHNAVRENRVGHAYLLSGPRGTGKTTTARILAKALNCTDLADGEPCGECESCEAIEAGASYDLQELDAASNNGVDAMRDLIAKAALGSPGRTKVYLLDEVHMLSTGASNALLKTLEEPPGHVVFVLATTDPHKVLPTIRSRTQHFELHLLPADDLGALVGDVVADADLDVDDEAIQYALRTGAGSARDTLSALDQVVAAGGVLDRGDQVDELVDALAAGDTGATLRAVSDAVSRGHDPRVTGEALLARMRDVFLHRMGDPLSHASESERNRAAGWAEHFSDRNCTRALEEVGEALREMRTAPDARIPLEVALVRLTRSGTDTSLEGLAARVEQLERGGSRPPAEPGTPPASGQPSRPADAARAAIEGRRGQSDEPDPQRSPAVSPAPAPKPPADPEEQDHPAPSPPSPAPSPATAAPTPPATTPTPPSAAPPTPPSETASAPTPPPAPPTDPPPARPTGPPATSASETPPPATASDSAGTELSIEQLRTAWTDQVLPQLSGLTKAMFSVGHFVDIDGSTARFVVPNDVHRAKSLQKLDEVEAAIRNHLGHAIALDLMVEGTPPTTRQSPPAQPSPTSGTQSPSSSDNGPTAAPDDPIVDEVDEIGPVDELADAPDDDRDTTQRVIDAFPGAEIIE